MNQDHVERVKKCLAEVCALDEKEIRSDSRLIDDLGADSLDLVELMYLLEQEFSIQLEKNDLSLSTQLDMPEHEVHQNEVLTPKALAGLRDRFPHAMDLLVEGTTRVQLAPLLTVGEVARSVERKLAKLKQVSA